MSKGKWRWEVGETSDNVNNGEISSYQFGVGAVHVGGGWSPIAFVSLGNDATAEVANQKFPKALTMVLCFSLV